jgi:hypothetical protein
MSCIAKGKSGHSFLCHYNERMSKEPRNERDTGLLLWNSTIDVRQPRRKRAESIIVNSVEEAY